MTWTVPGPDNGGPVWAVCACTGHPWYMDEIISQVPARIVLQVVRTELLS
jgi:hypothetical protein